MKNKVLSFRGLFAGVGRANNANIEEAHYFITRSDVVKDRIVKDKELLPFIATIKKVKNYTVYE